MTDPSAAAPQTEPRDGADPAADPQAGAYQVLARKYRPARFADLLGQDAVVRTLTNAIESGRVAHAFVLTGVRGVGKTTTARIIARALNCTGADGRGGPTPEPCGVCDNCVAIAEDRHVDVIEMDAASRTGIGDIRELIEGVRYRPVQARNKVYIIDEVHMLSTAAFNGLLKTLEEPPEHVVFIFATTEVRKVPVTVLSRCQRFDLHRLDRDELSGHFATIADAEGMTVSADALAMIARAADGSVRDGLSLLDQAMALAGGAAIDAEQVRAMLGLADRACAFDLFEAVMRGRAPAALEQLGALHEVGADPAIVLQDLLEIVHFVTRGKLVPETLEGRSVPETERVRGRDLAQRLSLPALARGWQVLLKGLGEVRAAPVPLQAAEMVLIRLAYASELPSPAELVARLEGAAATEMPPRTGGGGAPGASPGPGTTRQAQRSPTAAAGAGGAQAVPAPDLATESPIEPEARDGPEARTEATAPPPPNSFDEVVALLRARKESMLANHLERDVRLVRFEPGRIEFRPDEGAPRNLAGRLGAFLQTATGARWMVSVSQEAGAEPLAEQRRTREAELTGAALEHPLVRAALETFPGARLIERRDVPAASRESGSSEPDDTPEQGDERP